MTQSADRHPCTPAAASLIPRRSHRAMIACAWLALVMAACDPNAPATSAPKHEQYVVFVGADFALGSAAVSPECSREKHETASRILKSLSDSLFARSASLVRAGGKPVVEFYALNEHVTPLGSSDEWNTTELRTDYDIERAGRLFHEALLAKYEQVLMNRSGTDLNDIIGSVSFINGKRSAWFHSAPGSAVRVIYVNDMLHYNTNQSTDSGSGQFNFADAFSLSQFQNNIRQGFLWDPQRTRLGDLAGAGDFQVFSILLPRCADEPWPGGQAPDFKQLYPSVNQSWDDVFRALGADDVALGLTSAGGVFSRLATPSGA